MKRRQGPKVETILVTSAVRLVTLEESMSTKGAKGAFVRLRPSKPLPPSEVEQWRHSVAKVARAVKVIPGPRTEAVSQSAHRPEYKVGTIREESIKIAEETENADVIAFVKKVLDEVGA